MSGDIREKLTFYEDIIDNLQKELEFYRKEQENLKKEVIMVIDENKRLSGQVRQTNFPRCQLFSTDDEKTELEQISVNLKCQINLLAEENKNLDSIWKLSKTTIMELEKEIAEYRQLLNQPNSIVQIKEEYDKRINALELRLKEVMNESQSLSDKNLEVQSEKTALDSKVEELCHRVEELTKSEKALTEKQLELTTLKLDFDQLVLELEDQRLRMNDCMRREAEALGKMHEALDLAEDALKKKDEAVKQYDEIKGEFDKLVQILGDVMRDAGAKVDKAMHQMRDKYKDRLQKMEKSVQKYKEEVKSERSARKRLFDRTQSLEKKLIESYENTKVLDRDLQNASQNIIEMELKVEAFEKLLSTGEETNMVSEDRIKELECFLVEDRNLRNMWKSLITDVTSKLQNEMKTIVEYATVVS